MTRARIALLLTLLTALFARQPVLGQAQEGLVNKLLAPGPLMSGHKDLEHADCLKCHDAGQGVPNAKCLACHAPIGNSIKGGDSFHANVHKKQCFTCHGDHKGRANDTTNVNQKTFDHSQTGFKLGGAHAKAKCSTCHTDTRAKKATRTSDVRFFGKPTSESCISCHKKDDVHFFTPKFAAKECSTCHSDVSWKAGITFNHERDAGYKLEGDHATFKCAKCHLPNGKSAPKYDFPQLKTQKCLTCHKDHHANNLSPKFRGGNCAECHTQTEWNIKRFDHKKTGFDLKGAHATVNCVNCHKQAPPKQPEAAAFKFVGLNQSCISCHKDYHGFGKETGLKGNPLAQCQTCHTEVAWKPPHGFVHNNDTSFDIDGKHVGLKCFECHKPKGGGLRTYEWPQLETKTCETCHKNPHVGNPLPAFKQKCTTCHVTAGWKIIGKGSGGGFNHNSMTKFPLTGDHAKVKCDGCHKVGGKNVFKFPSAKQGFCIDCHKSPHAGQFQDKFAKAPCMDCHNTTDFAQKSFNHGLADFILTGEHKRIENKCTDCHINTNKTMPNTKPPKIAHKFIFEHGDKGFCINCHKNVHKDQFSARFPATNCQQCHNTEKFSSLLSFNHNKTRYKITGAHVKFAKDCVKCHVKTDQMLDTNPPKPAGKFQFPGEKRGFCEACHTDVHEKQFSEKFSKKVCTECHTTQSFTKRRAFNHDTTDFKLTGAHTRFQSDCKKCHTKTSEFLPTKPPKPAGKFQFAHEKTGFCESCHKNEHDKQFHPKFAEEACQQCHLTSQFHQKQKFDHKLAAFLIKGKHKEVKCGECHTRTDVRYVAPPKRKKGKFLFNELEAKDCATCHKDPHSGRFGKRCSECHTEDGWDETAEYHRNMNLGGTHYMLECNECHVDKMRLSGMGDDCKLCHQKDDAHMGSRPDCASCHTQQFWSVTKFKHSLTDFPLRGAHRLLQCDSCHAQGVYEGQASECIACHFNDAAAAPFPNHKLGGFETCQQCHNQFSFQGAKNTGP